jgi:hypothetical protein
MNDEDQVFRVEIVTEDLGLFPPEATGFSVLIQAARVVVTHKNDWRSHVIAWAGTSPGPRPPEGPVAKLFPLDIVSFVRFDAEGETTLSCAVTDELTLFAAASAAATVKRSWGWDESPTITVRFAQGPSFSVDPVFDGRAWIVHRRSSSAAVW